MLQVEHVSKLYEKVAALEDVSLQIRDGECVSLIGESGSGKSTLTRLILALDKPTKGSVFWRGNDVWRIPRRSLYGDIQPVFQSNADCFNPRRKIRESLMEPMRNLLRLSAPERERRSLELLSLVGLESSIAERYPHELSGGQRKRICIARALSVRPKLIVLDEAVSGLDITVMLRILSLLKELQNEIGCAYLFITHDIRAAVFMSKTIAVMKDGKIIEVAKKGSAGFSFTHPFSTGLIRNSF